MTLPEFLLARIAEDEAHWKRLADGLSVAKGLRPDRFNIGGFDFQPSVPVIPAKLLAECDAKRRIVEHVTNVARYADGSPGVGGIDPNSLPAVTHVLRLLALPYADHESFKEEWRV